MDILYKDILTRIAAQVPAVKWTGWDNGEIDLIEKHYPIPFPNVLIDFSEYTPESVGMNVQVGQLLIRIRIAFRIYDDMNSIAPSTSQSAGFTVIRALNDIYKALQGWTASAHYNELERVAQSRERRDDELTVYTMDFMTNFRDSHATPDYDEKSGVELSIYANEDPPATVADFEADNLTPLTTDNVTFTDLSTDAPTAWLWVINDVNATFVEGTTSASQNPVVNFGAAGSYTISMTATNAFGEDTETKSKYIEASDPE